MRLLHKVGALLPGKRRRAPALLDAPAPRATVPEAAAPAAAASRSRLPDPAPQAPDPVPAAPAPESAAALPAQAIPEPTPAAPAPRAMPEAVEPRPAPRPEAPEIDILSLLPPELRQPSPLPASPEPAALAAPAAPPPTRLAPVAPPEDFDVGAMLAAEFRQPARPPRGPSEAERAARLAMGPPPGARAAPKGPSIAATSEIAGFVGSCLVDSETGLMLASEGGGDLDLEAVAALNTEVIRAEQEAIAALGLDDRLEDILVTTTRQVHVLRPLEATPSVFLYLALDRKAANLGMALRQLGRIEATLAP